MKKLCVFFLAAIIFAAVSSITVAADTHSDMPDLTLANSVYVYNLESGLEVCSKNPEEPTPPAGTAKLMTAIIAYEYYKDDFSRVITVPEEAVKMTVGNSIDLSAGEEVTVDELLTALIAGGANDAANTFAIEIAGDIESFCDMMNQKAVEIGAHNTVYKNACGIDSDAMVTTAKDTSLIVAYAYKLPGFREYASVTRYVMEKTNKSSRRVIHNRNYLLSTHIETKYYDPDAIGMNTGFTQNGGFCTVSVAEKGGLTYIFVVMNAVKDANGDNSSFYIISDLIDWTLKSFGYITVLDPSTIVREVPVSLAKNVDYVIVSPESKVEYFLPLDTDVSSEISYEINLDSKVLTAPIYEGQKVGTIDVVYKGSTIAAVSLVTKNNISASTFLRMLDYCKNLLKSRQVKIALTVFAILFVSYLILSYIQFTRSHKNKNRRK